MNHITYLIGNEERAQEAQNLPIQTNLNFNSVRLEDLCKADPINETIEAQPEIKNPLDASFEINSAYQSDDSYLEEFNEQYHILFFFLYSFREEDKEGLGFINLNPPIKNVELFQENEGEKKEEEEFMLNKEIVNNESIQELKTDTDSLKKEEEVINEIFTVKDNLDFTVKKNNVSRQSLKRNHQSLIKNDIFTNKTNFTNKDFKKAKQTKDQKKVTDFFSKSNGKKELL